MLLNGFKRIFSADLPPLPRYYYHVCILYFIDYYRKTVDNIFRCVKGTIKLPIEIKHLEEYLTGYKFIYTGFPKVGKINGYHCIDGDTVNIFYSKDLNKAQIKFTKVHELFHFHQSIDPQAREIFEDIGKHCEDEHAKNVIGSLNEEVADLAAFIYLMPPEYPDKNSQKARNTLTDLIEYNVDCLRDSIKFI